MIRRTVMWVWQASVRIHRALLGAVHGGCDAGNDQPSTAHQSIVLRGAIDFGRLLRNTTQHFQ